MMEGNREYIWLMDANAQVNMRHGHGELQWPDGKKYKGWFEKGKQHGIGVIVDGRNETERMWKEGNYISIKQSKM